MIVSSLILDLETSLPGKVLTPELKEYEESIKRFSDSAVKKAGAIVYPVTNQDVSTAITLAAKHSIPLAVSGGRHSTSGDNSSDGGLVIDLRRMRSVSVNVAEKTVKAGGGCVWLDVDSALAAHGLSVVGGTVNQTGIGGLTLGGGYGWLSGQQGLTLDRLIAAEVVLANGSIITTSATEEPDLFWALRGAGQSFGVVTSFTFQASDQLNTVYGGMLAWPATSEVIRHVLDFANAIAKGDDARAGILVGFNSPPPMAGKLAVIAACFLDARHEEGEAFYSPLLNIEPFMNTLTLMPYETMNSLFNQTAAINGGRRIQKGGSFQPPLPAEAFERAINKFEDVCDKVPNMKAQSMCLFEFYPPHAICAVGETDTAFGNRGTHQNLMASLKWDDDSFDAIARTGAAEIVNASKDIVKKDGKETGEYLNYDGLGAPAEKIFGVNFKRLQELKGRYDPHNVFNKRVGLVGPTKSK